MAQCGSFVPASSLSMTPFCSMHMRLFSPESIASTISSAWASDLTQVAEAIRGSTKHGCRSLVLLDEFGKGTDECSGAALLQATLEFWAQKPRADRPVVLAISHMLDVVRSFGNEKARHDASDPGVSFFTMDYVKQQDGQEQLKDDVQNLYKVSTRKNNRISLWSHQ